MPRSRFLLSPILVLLLAVLAAAVPATAQDATPAPAAFTEELGLPELRVTVTDAAFEGLPAEVVAGRYLVTLEIEAAEGGVLSFMQLPDGMGLEEFNTMLAGPPAASPEAPMGTPAAEVGPPEEEGGDGPPEWYYQTAMAGGTGAYPGGQTAQIVVELTPGEWIAWADDPAAPQAPVGLTVTASENATPEAEAGLAADAIVTMYEYDFTVEGELAAGSQVIEVTNVGAQPHHMYMVRLPDSVTEEQIGQILELEMQGATPAPDSGLPNPDEFLPVAYVAPLSTGTTAWIPVNLEPGTYGMVCFVPDLASGMPHAFEGMYQVFEVAGS